MKKILAIIIAFLPLVLINAQEKKAEEPRRIKVMTYNLRFGELSSLEQLAEHIKAFNPDFVALQEVDVKTYRERAPKQNGKDFIGELAFRTGMFGLYGKSIYYKDGYYGIGILSKYPYIKVQKVMLPRPEEKEQRVMLYADFELSLTDTLTFACTHLDYFSAETRQKQTSFINNILLKSTYPVVLGGDFNAQPDSPEIKKEMSAWSMLTNNDFSIPAWKPEAKIDYIFGYPKKHWKVVRSQTIQSSLSDHLPIITELEIVNDNN